MWGGHQVDHAITIVIVIVEDIMGYLNHWGLDYFRGLINPKYSRYFDYFKHIF